MRIRARCSAIAQTLYLSCMRIPDIPDIILTIADVRMYYMYQHWDLPDWGAHPANQRGRVRVTLVSRGHGASPLLVY